jgi:Fe-S oxidoreductase
MLMVCKEILEKCLQCGLCEKDCVFLRKHGMPGELAEAFLCAGSSLGPVAFECSLCRLCASICPQELDPARMFLEVRRHALAAGYGVAQSHAILLNYERRGLSRSFSFYGLPQGCTDVFFPGCALSGMYPARARQLFDVLSQAVPALGIVLDCCARPSHDLGRREPFDLIFREMTHYLGNRGVNRVWTACPSCHDIFRRYGNGLVARTVYELLAETPPPRPLRINGVVAIHDPCVTRRDWDIQEAVRRLIRKTGPQVLDMPHERDKTVCCGEGGGVRFLQPALAQHWTAQRVRESRGARIVTYCAGCVAQLGSEISTVHILDYLFEPEAAAAGTVRPARSPWTYLNRLLLKHRLKRARTYLHTRERALPSSAYELRSCHSVPPGHGSPPE